MKEVRFSTKHFVSTNQFVTFITLILFVSLVFKISKRIVLFTVSNEMDASGLYSVSLNGTALNQFRRWILIDLQLL